MHYENGVIIKGCTLIEAISADRLCDYKVGATKITVTTMVLMSNNKTGTYVISKEMLDCNRLKEFLRIGRVCRWWTAIWADPHVYTVRGKEVKV